MALAFGVSAATPRVTVSLDECPQQLRPRIEAQLRAELPSSTRLIESTADLSVRVKRTESALIFVIARTNGAGEERRSFTIDGNPTRAIRLGIRVVIDRVTLRLRLTDVEPPTLAPETGPAAEKNPTAAAETPSVASPPASEPSSAASRSTKTAPRRETDPSRSSRPDAGSAPGPAPRPPGSTRLFPTSSRRAPVSGPHGWTVEAHFGGLWWQRPSSLQLGVELEVGYQLADWRIAARSGVYGYGCCRLSVDNRLQGDLLIFLAAVTLERTLIATSPVRISLFADAGASIERVRINPIGFAGNTQPQNREAVSGVGRLGVQTELALSSSVQLAFAVGAWARIGRLRLRLPAPFDSENPDIDAGVLVPFAAVALLVRFFDETGTEG